MSKTVLIIDDDKQVVDLFVQVLSSEGYNALTAHNGEAGLEIWNRHHPIINLVITNMGMPIMDGTVVISTIRATHPDAKILATSGNPETEKNCQADIFLHMPFKYSDLVSAVTSLTQ